MTVASEILKIFGWRSGNPNIADGGSATSITIASSMFEQLGVTQESHSPGQTLGSQFETAITKVLSQRLFELDQDRHWSVGSQQITEFSQYEHLEHIRSLAEEDQGGTLRSSLGTDYLIKPDITIGILQEERQSQQQHLHAAVSCKWTIRSDRVQNIRHEGVILTRHRRGRQPHIVAVTAEPLPSRLAAIARGTGELDCVYHVALQQLQSACPTDSESEVILMELIEQDRLRPFSALAEVIAFY